MDATFLLNKINLFPAPPSLACQLTGSCTANEFYVMETQSEMELLIIIIMGKIEKISWKH